jgi:DNA-binding Lrp family transcriptional regulator
MITFLVQVRCSRDLIPETAQAIAALDDVAEVYSVSGEWDLVAVVRVKAYEEVARVVTERMVKVPGIVRTHTISAFRVYAKPDRGAGSTADQR